MQWIYMTYEDSKVPKTSYAPSLCHPHFARARTAYMAERYGAAVLKVQHTENNHIDLGGMMMLNEPSVRLQLGTQRYISCWEHQVGGVLTLLHAAPKKMHAGRNYRRLSRFPGVIVYISDKDCRRFLEFLKDKQNDIREAGHRRDVQEALNGAIRRK